MKTAWQLERDLRTKAVPVDRRIHPSRYKEAFVGRAPTGDDLIRLFWESRVPGSQAPEIPYQEMVQAQGNRGFDVSRAERLIPQGLELYKQQQWDELRVLTAQLMEAIQSAPIDSNHAIHSYQHPESWEDVRAAMGMVSDSSFLSDRSNLHNQIYHGWLGQLAGGSFGTVLEGYTGEQIQHVYGDIHSYIVPPETTNDDVVYELVFLDVFEKMGREITSQAIGLEWVKQIPFGWSAEWIALRNLQMGIFPPESGSFQNPYSHWIGAQMRGMICGLLAPSWPMESARLAHLDGVVSHDSNGVYGEIYAAVLTSLAFVRKDIHEILVEGFEYLPRKSQYADVVRFCLATVQAQSDPTRAWKILDKQYEQYNWIDAHPNIAAVIYSLWYSQGAMTDCFSLLAKAGLDVDCNGGLAGTVLGVMKGTPAEWSTPIGDLLETYLKGKERLSIRELANRTYQTCIK
jgi:ADP-ribosylglycohydrolase